MTDLEEDMAATPYAERVGERLRGIRRQKRLSLQDVEASSSLEFKASVLGAYERGERAISVPRLQRLSRFYNVPVDQLLPPDEGPAFPSDAGLVDAREPAKVVIDLNRLDGMDNPALILLGRFLRMIQLQRQDFNGKVLSVRWNDVPAIACMLGTAPEQAVSRLDELGLRFTANLG